MTPEFEFPNSLIGREQFPQVPPTTATWRTLELSGSATVSLRFGSSAGIAELDCNGALAASAIVMLLEDNVSRYHAVLVDQAQNVRRVNRYRNPMSTSRPLKPQLRKL